MKIVTSSEMRQIEQECAISGIATSVLMENAGKAVAEEVTQILGTVDQKRVLVLAGPGNNGGDGLVAARYLHDWGAGVSVYFYGSRLPGDQNFELLNERGISRIEAGQNGEGLDELLSSTDLIIDALFGTGVSRPLGSMFVQALDKVRLAKQKYPGLQVVAVDLPSGLNADTGTVDPACLYTDYTITLGFAKPGLFNSPGADRAGRISVVDIGIPAELASSVAKEIITEEWVRSVLPKRPGESNKGSFGKVLVVAGSINYIGAAYLVCSGAMRVGAGLVTLATPVSLLSALASKMTEVTYLPLTESRRGIVSPESVKILYPELERYYALLLGSGLGQSQSAVYFIRSMLLGRKVSSSPSQESKGKKVSLFKGGQETLTLPPLVLDADALNTLARIPNWWKRLTANAVLTPHPGEMARLAGMSVEEVQSDRTGLASRLAVEWHKTIVLKGAYTVVATPDGQYTVNPFANAGLASAGTGDVLCGVIGGLMAQGLTMADAAACGVYLHGKAGDMVRSELGDAGMVASDLLPVLPSVIKRLKMA